MKKSLPLMFPQYRYGKQTKLLSMTFRHPDRISGLLKES